MLLKRLEIEQAFKTHQTYKRNGRSWFATFQRSVESLDYEEWEGMVSGLNGVKPHFSIIQPLVMKSECGMMTIRDPDNV